MRIGVLLAVGVGVATLMALWPLMVALSDAAVFGLSAVAVLALAVLAVDAFEVIRRRSNGSLRRDRSLKLRSGCSHSHS